MFRSYLLKVIAAFFTVLAISILCSPAIRAQNSEALLQQIANNTAGILQTINQIPPMLATFFNNWMGTDDPQKTTANLQNIFGNMSNAALTNSASQLTLQNQLTTDFLGSSATPQNMPFANDIVFQTMLGQLYYTPDPRAAKNASINPAYNYLKNVSALNVSHATPSANWRGSADNQQRYVNYYLTASAVQSYDAYVLSQIYVNLMNGNTFTQQQTALLKQAGDSSWFSQVASENLGLVLRQLLMYSSQTFLLLTDMLQTEKQMLAAQAMTNSLLIISNQQTESNLLDKATGVIQ